MATETRDTVEDLITASLDHRGLTAMVASLRCGQLVLAASPQDAALLRFDTDHLLAEVNAALADDQTPLRSVRVKVARHP